MSSNPDFNSKENLPHDPLPEELASVARAASIIAIGNIISRVLGLARDIAKSYYFGATGLVHSL